MKTRPLLKMKENAFQPLAGIVPRNPRPALPGDRVRFLREPVAGLEVTAPEGDRGGLTEQAFGRRRIAGRELGGPEFALVGRRLNGVGAESDRS